MKVLFVTPQLPWPPAQGTTLRNYHLLAAVAAQHKVDLLSFQPGPPADGAALQHLRSLCSQVEVVAAPARPPAARLRDLALGWADMERRLWSPEFAVRLQRAATSGTYDLIQLEGFEMAGYLLGPSATRRLGQQLPSATPGRTRLVFDDHNAEYQLQASVAAADRGQPGKLHKATYSWTQARRLRLREAQYCAAADATIAVSDADAGHLTAICPGLFPDVIPNGVDTSQFSGPAPAGRPTVFFSGKLDYRPNVDACEWLVREIMPTVRRSVPDVQVVLAGRDPSAAVRALSEPGVEITGELSEEELARRRGQAWVYVVPMRMGSGVRFKVLEAMAAGVPIVATPLGASGAGLMPGVHGLIAADTSAFAVAVVRLLQNGALRSRLAEEALGLARERHDWKLITPRLLLLYDRLAAPRRQGVSVICTVLNERATVGGLLDSLAAQRRRPDEVVFVDGGSTDGTPEAIAAWCRDGTGGSLLPAPAQAGPLPIQLLASLGATISQAVTLPIRVVTLPGANISQGRNAAIRAASHEIVAATDAGVVLAADWLERLCAPLELHPGLHAVSGFFVARPDRTSRWELALGATTLPDVSEIAPATFLPSSRSVAFRKQAWAAAGGYPEWLDFCEDLVFDFRLNATTGRPRFVPQAVVGFRPRSSAVGFFRQYYRYARGDGKAGLWRGRHAIRYATYLTGALLASQLWRDDRWPAAAAAALIGGSLAYLKAPIARLYLQAPTRGAFLAAALLLPLVRLTGDLAKMAGYPAGLRWRTKRPMGDGV